MTRLLQSVATAMCLTATLCLFAAPAFAGQATNTFDVKVILSTGASGPGGGGSGGGGGGGSGGGGGIGGGGGGGGGGAGNVNDLSPALCRNSTSGDAFGARATVVCSTGALVDIAPGSSFTPWAPMHGGAFRYITQVSWNGEWVDSIDDTPGTGTITSWRVVHSMTHNYLELTLGW